VVCSDNNRANRRLVGRVFFGGPARAANQQAATDAIVGYAVFSLGSGNRLYPRALEQVYWLLVKSVSAVHRS
jgi:hypothetical protein